MYPMIPTESLAGTAELLCYVFTTLGAVLSFLFTLR